ncbi:MAG: hypothetical protein ACOYL5_11010 [Phototrophicaceae bacterium]|jgi:hypothetical protein
MQLIIENTPQTFIPLRDFRAQFGLPESFGLAGFQPKPPEGLASLDAAGDALSTVQAATLDAWPQGVPPAEWLTHVPPLTTRFEAALMAINARVGLREQEIAYAVDGFSDVIGAAAFALLRAHLTHTPAPTADTIYADWLQATVMLGTPFEIEHHGATWELRAVHHAYGRVGLQITTPQRIYYVSDKALACPAEGFMAGLLKAAVAAMIAGTA